MRRLGLILACLAAALGCSQENLLLVGLRTDMVQGRDFVAVEAERFDTEPEGDERAADADRLTLQAAGELDFRAGVRIGQFRPARSGAHYVRVRLLDVDGVVLERLVLVQLEGTSSVTAVMTRSCRDVACPADSVALSQCQGSRCVDPACSDENPEACPAPQCTVAADCPEPADCAEAVCQQGTCLAFGVEGRCVAPQHCEPESGCRADETEEPAYVRAVMDDEPVAYWRLGEAAPTLAADMSGSGFDGTYIGNVTVGVPGAVCGDEDTAARFDGLDDEIRMGDILAFLGTSPMSVEAWINLPDNQGSGAILGKVQRLSSDLPRDGYYLTIHALGADPHVVRWHRDDAMEQTSANTLAPTPGSWAHIVATFDGTTRWVYVNGQGMERDSAAELIATDAEFLVGNAQGWQRFAGDIDEIAIYDHALSHARVLAHYEAGTCM